MKSYPHIISKLFYEPLVITPNKHRAICQVLETRLAASSDILDAKSETDDTSEVTQVGSTMIIPIYGTIIRHGDYMDAMSGCCSLDRINELIDLAENDNSIRRVIYDFRTPGGEVTGVPETGRKIYRSRKETIAFTDSDCCSGGIWLASQCKQFYATGSSRVGSVGVYTLCFDESKALAEEGLKVNAIFAGKYKLLGAYWKPLEKDEEAILQKSVDKIYDQFKSAITAHREVSDKNFGNGLVFDGEEAAQIGFTDGVVESLDDIIDGYVE